MTIYLDCNATTPMEPAVRDVVVRYMIEDFGNAGSVAHEFGARAHEAVQQARRRIARALSAAPDEVIFTSGATEANNLAILGLMAEGERSNRRHVLTSAIEHKAVLEPCDRLRAHGFDVELLPVTRGGWVDPDEVRRRLRSGTLLVSIMHSNNETGVIQPLSEIAGILEGHPAFFHVDAAQGFGKEFCAIRTPRIDLVSVSGHKIFGPKGVGALVARRRGYDRVPLTPLLVGGGQERGLRPGTLPVPLIVGLSAAAELAEERASERLAHVMQAREGALTAFVASGAVVNGDSDRTQPHVLNIAFPNVDSEALLLAWKPIVAAASGAACTSRSYSESHVLRAMGLEPWRIKNAVRLSWCHMTQEVPWDELARIARSLA